jgi:hypothetical protein
VALLKHCAGSFNKAGNIIILLRTFSLSLAQLEGLMRISKHVRFLAMVSGYIFFVSGMYSCIGDDACKSNRVVGLNISMLTSGTAKPHDTIIKNLRLYGVGSRYLMLDSTDASYLSLPLDATSDSIALVLATGEGNDTLIVKYKREIYLLSVECGFITRYHLLNVAISGISADSAVIKNPLVVPDGPENISIYY